jgi:hypothetical protein
VDGGNRINKWLKDVRQGEHRVLIIRSLDKHPVRARNP